MSAREGLSFAEPAVEGLLREGKLEPRWVGAFFPLADEEPLDGETWTPAFFRLQHFVCMYLPMRYAVWRRSSGKRVPETEGLLATLVITVTERLWRGLCCAAARGAPKLSPMLVRSVLGPGNPLRSTGEERVAWGQRYAAEVKGLAGPWRARLSWPRWEAMALQVASFYAPMGLPVGANFDENRLTTSQRKLLEDLGPHVHVDVLELIGRWFAAAEALRDEAGVPLVDWNAGEKSKLIGRTETEFLLLG